MCSFSLLTNWNNLIHRFLLVSEGACWSLNSKGFIFYNKKYIKYYFAKNVERVLNYKPIFLRSQDVLFRGGGGAGGGGGVLSPFSPKYGTSLLKFWPEVVYYQIQTVPKQSFKIKCLSGNGTYPKLKVLVDFWAQFILGKPKILPKPELSL